MLLGQRCQDCGRVAFPPDPYGCEQCGATPDRLASVDLAARGRIRAVATVHRHHHPEPATPFTVATVVLDDGPMLKAVLVANADDRAVGATVRGMTVPVSGRLDRPDDDSTDDSTDGDRVDLRFEIVPEGDAATPPSVGTPPAAGMTS